MTSQPNSASLARRCLSALLISILSGALAAAEPAQELFRTVDLDIGELQQVKLADGSTANIKLLSVVETRDGLRDAVRRAQVKIEVNGAVTNLISANYHLPLTFAGVQIDCPVTKGYYTNRDRWEDSWGLDK